MLDTAVLAFVNNVSVHIKVDVIRMLWISGVGRDVCPLERKAT